VSDHHSQAPSRHSPTHRRRAPHAQNLGLFLESIKQPLTAHDLIHPQVPPLGATGKPATTSSLVRVQTPHVTKVGQVRVRGRRRWIGGDEGGVQPEIMLTQAAFGTRGRTTHWQGVHSGTSRGRDPEAETRSSRSAATTMRRPGPRVAQVARKRAEAAGDPTIYAPYIRLMVDQTSAAPVAVELASASEVLSPLASIKQPKAARAARGETTVLSRSPMSRVRGGYPERWCNGRWMCSTKCADRQDMRTVSARMGLEVRGTSQTIILT
jgi:hypothetical protein